MIFVISEAPPPRLYPTGTLSAAGTTACESPGSVQTARPYVPLLQTPSAHHHQEHIEERVA